MTTTETPTQSSAETSDLPDAVTTESQATQFSTVQETSTGGGNGEYTIFTVQHYAKLNSLYIFTYAPLVYYDLITFKFKIGVTIAIVCVVIVLLLAVAICLYVKQKGSKGLDQKEGRAPSGTDQGNWPQALKFTFALYFSSFIMYQIYSVF